MNQGPNVRQDRREFEHVVYPKHTVVKSHQDHKRHTVSELPNDPYDVGGEYAKMSHKRTGTYDTVNGSNKRRNTSDGAFTL